MNKLIITIALLAALAAPFNANAITAEQLIRQKQANALNLQRGSAARINSLKNTSNTHPTLQNSFNATGNMSDLEPASGDEAPNTAVEPAAPAAAPVAPIKAETHKTITPAKTPAEKPLNADQLKGSEPAYPPGGVI